MTKQIKSCIDGLLFDSTLQICTWAEDVHDSNMRQLKQREKQRGGEDKEGDLLASSNLVAAAADKVDDEVGGGGTNEANQQLLHERNAIDTPLL